MEDHQDIRDGVTALCAEFPGEYWQKLDARNEYPDQFVAELTASGYLAALIPEEFGGSGLGVEAAGIILEEISRSGGQPGACHAQMYTMGSILRHGSQEQKARYLPEIANGAMRLQAFGVTEPTAGTDTTSIKTFARREGDKYIVNGQKIWISRAEHSDLLLLLARTTPKDQVTHKTEGLSLFLVEMNNAIGNGLTIRPIETMMNHHTTELFFDDLEIPVSTLIGDEGKGFRYVLDSMNVERTLIAFECIGDSKFFIERAKEYACSRKVFDRPIGSNQAVQFPIAQAYAEMRAAELMAHEAARLFDAGERCGAEANMAKMLAADASWSAGNTCLQTHGGYGFAREFDIERKFRETRLYQVAPISTNLILSFIGEHVLGMPRSY